MIRRPVAKVPYQKHEACQERPIGIAISRCSGFPPPLLCYVTACEARVATRGIVAERVSERCDARPRYEPPSERETSVLRIITVTVSESFERPAETCELDSIWLRHCAGVSVACSTGRLCCTAHCTVVGDAIDVSPTLV